MKPWLKQHLARKKHPRCSRCRTTPMFINLTMTRNGQPENYRLCEACAIHLMQHIAKNEAPEARSTEKTMQRALEAARAATRD